MKFINIIIRHIVASIITVIIVLWIALIAFIWAFWNYDMAYKFFIDMMDASLELWNKIRG